MKNYEIFLVDADGTLLDFNASSKAALKSTLQSYGKEWQEDYGKKFFALNDELWERLERKELTREKLHEIRFPLWLSMLELSVDRGDEKISGSEFNERYLTALSLSPVYISGAEEFLQALKKAGRVYIVTNGTEWIQKSRFSLCGLDRYVNGVFISEAVGADKPSPIYTSRVIKQIEDFTPAKAVWIGDSLSADVKAANEAKITSVWYNPSGKAEKQGVSADFTAKNFAGILDFLKIG